ncbi:hypothetical protein AB833_30665 [Chromatiales bacterium (ex Bugula neritina AB1)]|nr:hypothetical protein AB833_30665 [Chromatiales bacterium (ex Bugula neritina AB1)]
MSYLIALLCMFAIFLYARKQELPGSYFATLTLLLTVILANTGVVVAGIDALVAASLTMGAIGLATRYIDHQLTAVIEQGLITLPKPRLVSAFCTKRTHDFAVGSQNHSTLIDQINQGQWLVLEDLIGQYSAEERQGFYANLDYSAIDELAVLNFVNQYPENADGHILYGHLKLCKAKRQGLVPGEIPQESVAQTVAEAFKHFRRALRQDGNDAEALCGILLGKGFIALRNDHIESSLQKLLEIDPNHLHGVLAAGRFLINSGESANRFVAIVENSSASPEIIKVMANIVAHVEGDGHHRNVANADIIAALYAQLGKYNQLRGSLSPWQSRIAANIVAYALDSVGDAEGKNKNLSELDGQLSPYPWQSRPVNRGLVLNTMGYLAV